MAPTDIDLIETHNKDEITQKKKKRKKEEIDESEFRITMNPWGIAFMILFVAIIGYLAAGLVAYLPPFEYDQIQGEYIISDGLLVILCISALIFLGLGIYFGWVRKTDEQEEEEEEEDFTEFDEVKRKPTSNEQITFVYVKSEDDSKED
ncbi:MAG: hypothetical protein FK731_05860 [Asgard group archaeon]|nr:hypothetical protein [Asgard group archaeon]